MPTLSFEIRRLLQLAAPVVVTQLASMLLGVVDTIMVGHLNVTALAAASLGHVWTFGTMIFAMGVVLGIDPVVTQAHGAGDERRMGLALQHGVVVALLVSVPVSLTWLWTDRALILFGQPPELARMARDYAVVQIPALFFFLVYTAQRQHLQGRGIVMPAMVVAIVANLVNVAGNWILIFGHLGVPQLGLVGAGLASGLTRVFMMLAMTLLIVRGNLTKGAWVPWSREALDPKGLREVLHYGWPVGLQFSLEVWAFQIMTLLAGRLGESELAAHSIVLNVASVSFMLPVGISMAAVTRVGNLLGAGQPQQAQRAAWVAMGMGATVMVLSALVFVSIPTWIGRIYTSDGVVLALTASIFPIAAAFQLFDGTQVVGSGVLRGMGSTRPAALINLVAFYLLSLPMAAWMTFRLGWGLRGLWWGLVVGLASVALLLVAWIYRRGPAHHVEAARPS